MKTFTKNLFFGLIVTTSLLISSLLVKTAYSDDPGVGLPSGACKNPVEDPETHVWSCPGNKLRMKCPAHTTLPNLLQTCRLFELTDPDTGEISYRDCTCQN
jgi:hypothetical protein